jgi:hypothetical protein
MPLMHEAGLITHLLCHPGEKRDHIMLGHGLDGVDGGDINGGVRRPPVPQRLGCAFRHDAKLAQLFGGVGFDLEPDAVFRFRLPQGSHRGAGITGDHGGRPSGMKR